MNDDASLLRRWAEEKSEAAFAELVRRHLDLVYSAAQRRLGGDAHHAADVTQQVFVKLARDAARLSGHTVLAAWLYTATRNAALDLIRSEQRRAAREQEATAMQNLFAAAPEVDWARLRPVLDEVMDELSDADRTVVLLRFFERRPFAEIGTVLRISDDAARMRVERALEKLHVLLSRRGITSTAGALGAALAHQAVAAAPTGLAAGIVGAALSEAVDAGVSAGVLAFMTSTKITLALAVAAALAVGSALYQSSRARATAAELAAARDTRMALAARFAAVQSDVGRAEQALRVGAAGLGHPRTAEAQSAAAAAAAAQEKVLEAKALRTFLDRDPQLQELHRNFLRVWRLGTWMPLFQQLRLTPAEIEQTMAELQWRQDQDMQIRNPAPAPGFPEALAKNARFSESLKYPDASGFVDQIVREGAKAGVMFTREKADQLFQTFVELQPEPTPAGASGYPGQRDPYRQAMRTYDNWQVLRFNLDWEQVIAQAGGFLDSAQINLLHVQAALARRNKLGIWYQ